MGNLAVRVSMVATAPTRGRVIYGYPDVWGETEHPYAQDVWTCWLGKLALECTAGRQVLSVRGYLPHQDWQWVSALNVPDASSASFAINELFEPNTRNLELDCNPKLEVDGDAKTLRIRMSDVEGCKTYVRPHEGILLGASLCEGLLHLSEIWLVGIELTGDAAASGKPTPW